MIYFAADTSVVPSADQLLRDGKGFQINSASLGREHRRSSPRRRPLEQFGRHSVAGYQDFPMDRRGASVRVPLAANRRAWILSSWRPAALGYPVRRDRLVLSVLLIPGVPLHHIAEARITISMNGTLLSRFHGSSARGARAGLARSRNVSRAHRMASRPGGPRRSQLLCSRHSRSVAGLLHILFPAMRGAVLLTRPSLDPYDPVRLFPSLRFRLQESLVVRPRVSSVVSRPDSFCAVSAKADAKADPLHKFRQRLDRLPTAPELFGLIENEAFLKTAPIQGFDPTLTTFVRHRPDRISDIPFP